MTNIKPLFVYNLYLFITKASDGILIHKKFNDKSEEKTMFNQLIETPKPSKWQIDCLINVL